MPFLLDTVTISAFRRPAKAGPQLVQWQQSQQGQIGYLSVVTLNELRFGMKKVQSRDPVFASNLATWYDQIIALPDHFRILNVDRAIAEQAADFRAEHGTSFEDSLIAATAKIHGLTLATRNTADFKPTGISLVNPWEFSP
ncbi:type II toxin-antitoxin system VapC family toxin [Phragmitibacter flavus]|uniref:Type II toxin-antitoxin system VapC family toxin n=1 Tax=Phragmitibacter flavus TaxID=2576071 RepID=A0A5R8KAS6_9BACT|nr:type II toxin-antitoxin system VapC family toxin [Phragmitibacter flavus]TLD69412.1 type II toxin-antitoxin system VapC family toxin [Phragmitibacter flavus]